MIPVSVIEHLIKTLQMASRLRKFPLDFTNKSPPVLECQFSLLWILSIRQIGRSQEIHKMCRNVILHSCTVANRIYIPHRRSKDP